MLELLLGLAMGGGGWGLHCRIIAQFSNKFCPSAEIPHEPPSVQQGHPQYREIVGVRGRNYSGTRHAVRDMELYSTGDICNIA
jgi:hypothetical protein